MEHDRREGAERRCAERTRLARGQPGKLKPRRGFYVASLNIDEIEDIFEMRAMLEARAGQLATERMTAADADGNNVDVAGLSQLAYDPAAVLGDDGTRSFMDDPIRRAQEYS